MQGRTHISLFKLDHTDTTKNAAKVLQQKYDEHINKLLDFTIDNHDPFLHLRSDDLSNTVWLTHSTKHELGDYITDRFIEKFIANFNKKFTTDDKKKVQNLYLINCETELTEKNNISSATYLSQ